MRASPRGDGGARGRAAPGSGRGGGVRAGTRGGDAPRRRVGGSSARAARAALGRATPGRQAHRRGRRRGVTRRASALATTARGREASEARRAARAVAAARNRADAEAAVGVATADIIAARSLGPHAPPARAPPVRATRDGTFRASRPARPRGAVASRGAFGGSGLVLGAANEPGRVCAASRGRGARASRRVRAVVDRERRTGWVRRRTKGVPRVAVAPRERGANRSARRGICERGAAARATSVPTGAKKKSPGRMRTQSKSFGDEGHRSPYLLHAKQTLYHLSYAPVRVCANSHRRIREFSRLGARGMRRRGGIRRL